MSKFSMNEKINQHKELIFLAAAKDALEKGIDLINDVMLEYPEKDTDFELGYTFGKVIACTELASDYFTAFCEATNEERNPF